MEQRVEVSADLTDTDTTPVTEIPITTYTDKPTQVLLVKDFPVEFKTIDVLNLFTKKPRIKWIDDTSCLAIFNDPLIAKQEYISLCCHATIKFIPHQLEQQRKARPQTSDMVARRLIAGALGMRPVQKSVQEIESDKLKLEQARGICY